MSISFAGPGYQGARRPYDRQVNAPRPPILVVDDDPKIVRLVRAYLEREGFRVVEAGDGRTALAAVALEEPALVILDLMLPEVEGMTVLRALRRRSCLPVVVLSARGAVGDRIGALGEGADDYVVKPFSPAELVLRVRRVLDRAGETGARDDGGTPPALLRHADLTVDLERHEVRQEGRLVQLTAIEFRLLAALIGAGGRVLTRERLLDALYGHAEGEVLDRSIDVYVGRLRDKLGDDVERPRYVATVRGVGYRAAAP